MNSKARGANRSAKLPLKSNYAKLFKKDWQRLSHSGLHDMNRFKEAMLLLIQNNGPLPPEWLDHPLSGRWADHRELHVKGDLLLIYQIATDDDLVTFVRAGTHNDLFE